MNIFFDPSVLVAVADEDHTHHERASRRFEAAGHPNRYCAAHTMAEFYAVVTRLPVRPPLAPEQCILLLDTLMEQLTPVALSSAEYLATIRRAADAGLSGGIVYEALLLACARKCKAGAIYTFNERHFARVAPDLKDRIQAP